MSEVLKKEQERLVEYGKGLQEMATKVLPIFEGLVHVTAKTAKQLVGAQQEVADIRRKARVDHLGALIQGGATPGDAASIVLREMELAHEGSKLVETLLRAVPLATPMLPHLMELVAQVRQSRNMPETPEA